MLKLITNLSRFCKIRVNLTLNRDKDGFDDSPDEFPEEIEPKKPISQLSQPKASSKSKQLTARSKSVLGCDQIGIETLVSMLSSGGSDSEKEEQPQPQVQPPVVKPEVQPRIRTNMLRKSGKSNRFNPISISFGFNFADSYSIVSRRRQFFAAIAEQRFVPSSTKFECSIRWPNAKHEKSVRSGNQQSLFIC